MVHDSKSDRTMELSSNQLGVQFYTSNILKEVKDKNGSIYHKYTGLCLETQGYPNSANHINFPNMIVRPGEVYKHYMVYRFTAR